MPSDNRPALTSQHLADARLYANRVDMLAAIGCPRHGVICEVGVAMGDFSVRMMELLEPSQFVAFDIFTMHRSPSHWGRKSKEIFGSLTHEEFYRRRMAPYGDRVVLERGWSHEMLARYPDRHFDLIYLDAEHVFENVRKDAERAARKIKPGGLVVFNDYTLYDPFLKVRYGVVEAVNQMVTAGGWKVVGFALEHNMFCDIAIRRDCG